jgi:formate dehydrogenase maturation protein FdhE
MNINGNKSAGIKFATCRLCKKIYQTVDGDLCHKCGEKDTLKLLEVRAYINLYPNKNMTETAEANGITTNEVIRYLQEGSITMTPGLASEKLLNCSRCETPINTGIMCGRCRNHFNEDVLALKMENERNKLLDKGSGMHSSRSKDGRSRR